MLACPIHFGEINFLATLFDNILLIYLERGDVHHYQIESLIGPDCLPEASLQLAAMHFDLVSGGVVIIIKPMYSDLIDHAKVFAPKVASILLSSLLSLFLAILFAEHAFCEFCPPTHTPPDFLQLREYLRTRGDVLVPDHVELGMWCQVQRARKRRGALDKSRARALMELGFDFEGDEECR